MIDAAEGTWGTCMFFGFNINDIIAVLSDSHLMGGERNTQLDVLTEE